MYCGEVVLSISEVRCFSHGVPDKTIAKFESIVLRKSRSDITPLTNLTMSPPNAGSTRYSHMHHRRCAMQTRGRQSRIPMVADSPSCPWAYTSLRQWT